MHLDLDAIEIVDQVLFVGDPLVEGLSSLASGLPPVVQASP